MENNNHILGEKEKEKIAILVRKAMGDRTSATFAQLIGISPPLFSNLLNGKYKRKLPLHLLLKIDENKSNKSDLNLFEELCTLNGYSFSDTDRVLRSSSYGGSNFIRKDSIFTDIIILSIVNSGLIITEKATGKELRNDNKNPFNKLLIPDLRLKIQTKENGERYWEFHIFPFTNLPKNSFNYTAWQYHSRIAAGSSTIFLDEITQTTCLEDKKISFVFAEKELFKNFVDFYENFNLPVETSVLLFDTKNNAFKQEHFLGNKKTNELMLNLKNDSSHSYSNFDDVDFFN